MKALNTRAILFVSQIAVICEKVFPKTIGNKLNKHSEVLEMGMFFRNKTKEKMIDLHCHVLPGIDDGSQSMEQTMEMLRIASREGIEAIIVTPHYKEGRRNADISTIVKCMQGVQEKIEEQGLGVRLYPGNEIFYFDGVEELLEQDRVLTLNGTDRVLVEFSPTEEYTYIRNSLDNIRAQGYVPVLAHVERYECMVKHPEHVKELKHMDVEIQINASSVQGKLGRKVQQFLYQLLKDRCVYYVGTDAHNAESRAPEFQECYQMLKKKFDAAYIEEIFYENALAVIEAE